MSTPETILISAFVTAIVLAPKAIGAWLARRDDDRASRTESQLERATGGAE